MQKSEAHTGVPREGRGRGFKPSPVESSEFFWIVCLQPSKLCSYTHWILNFVQENVKNCVLISHFSSSFGDFVPRPSTGVLPLGHWGTSVPRSSGVVAYHVNPLHCKMLSRLRLYGSTLAFANLGNLEIGLFIDVIVFALEVLFRNFDLSFFYCAFHEPRTQDG